jgi:SAM-dependent methyltransferase
MGRRAIVACVTEHERFLRDFHAAHPGITARTMQRAGSYDRLAARVEGGRVLDLACGDGALLARLPAGAIGLDLSREELGTAPRVVQGRAQQLPFAAGSFEVVTCHLAFMLFDDLPSVVRELERVLVPGGAFLALLGGGPTADGDDAFHRFLDHLGPRTAPRLGDPRAKSETGWRELMPRWRIAPFERWELDLSGTFDQVSAFLGASYEVHPERAAELCAALRTATAEWGERIPCTAVAYLAQATVIQATSAK